MPYNVVSVWNIVLKGSAWGLLLEILVDHMLGDQVGFSERSWRLAGLHSSVNWYGLWMAISDSEFERWWHFSQLRLAVTLGAYPSKKQQLGYVNHFGTHESAPQFCWTSTRSSFILYGICSQFILGLEMLSLVLLALLPMKLTQLIRSTPFSIPIYSPLLMLRLSKDFREVVSSLRQRFPNLKPIVHLREHF